LSYTSKVFFLLTNIVKIISESEYASLIQAYAMNKMPDKAVEVLHEMRSGKSGIAIRPGLSSYTAAMMAALNNQDWNQVIHINAMMQESSINPSSATLQCVLLANMKLDNNEKSVCAIEDAIKFRTAIDADTFMLCATILLPKLHGGGNLQLIRNNMRNLSEKSPDLSEAAMELSKTLRECHVQDERRAISLKSKVLLQQKREQLWREALIQAMKLSKQM